MNKRAFLTGLATAALAFGADQFSKWYLLYQMHMTAEPPMGITKFFNLVMVWNYGISFGLLAGGKQPYMLIGTSAILVSILLIWLYKTVSPRIAAALGLVIGGAMGNIIDRFHYGAVADFFDVHLGIYHWPAFNIADSCIFIGVVVLCVGSMLGDQRKG